MEAPPDHQQYQDLDQTEEEFSLDCLNRLNRHLIETYKPPRHKAKAYRFVTTVNGWLGFFLLACCACPCLYFSKKLSESVNK